MARITMNKGNLEKARELYEESLHIHEKYYGKGSIQSSYALKDLGIVFKNQGIHEKAIEFLLKAL